VQRGQIRHKLSILKISILWLQYLDLLIKNGLAEKLEGEYIRYRSQAQGGETAATAPSGAGRLEPELEGAGAAKAQMNALEGLKYQHITIM